MAAMQSGDATGRYGPRLALGLIRKSCLRFPGESGHMIIA